MRKFLVLCLIGGVILGGSLAYASPTWLYAGGQVLDSSGTRPLTYGVAGSSWLYPKQASQDGDWVNSLYARQDDGDFYEAGWYWTPGSTSRVWFDQLMIDGVYMGENWYTVPGLADNTRALVTVRRLGTSGDDYAVYVNSVLRKVRYGTDITSCRAGVGAERYDTLDVNRGSWTNAQYLSYASGTWTYWVNAGADYTEYNNDSVYHFYSNRVAGSDHWVYVDDHQN